MSFAIAVIVLLGLGALAGAGLAFANRFFGVEEDPRVEEICEALPGANCGACGYPGCRGYAQAILAGEDICLCAPGGNDTIQTVAEILGVEAGEVVEKVAVVRCAGTGEHTQQRSKYLGIQDCHAAQLVGGGPNTCDAGCLGLGSCAEVCPESCIEIREGVALVDTPRCIGCGKCVAECPRDILAMVSKSQKVVVLCNNHDSGKKVRSVCKVGCTGCKLCAKKYEGFEVEDNLAQVQQDAPEASTEAALVCPSGSIIDLNTFSFEEMVFDKEARSKLKKLQKEHKKKQKEARAKKKAAVKKKKEAASAGEGGNADKGEAKKTKTGGEASRDNRAEVETGATGQEKEEKGKGAKESGKDGQEKD